MEIPLEKYLTARFQQAHEAAREEHR